MIERITRAAIVAVMLLAGCANETGPRATSEHGATASHVRIVFTGDVLLDDGPGQLIASGIDPFLPTAPWLSRADLAVGNLECPIALRGTAARKIYQFRAHPRTLSTLAAHFGLVSLANNHSGDYGREALLDTMNVLDNAGVAYIGAGKDLQAAHAPRIIERNGIKFALLGYDEYHPRWFEAGHAGAGVAWSEEEQVIRDIHRAQQLGARIVIPFLHWGWENDVAPCQRQRDLARRLIDAGAAAVVGAHPHVTQGAEIYRGKPIIYSLGNFLFNLFDSERNTIGWLLRLELDALGVARWDTLVVAMDARGVPSPKAGVPSHCGRRGDPLPTDCPAQIERVAACRQ